MSDLPSRDFFNGNDITMSGDRQLIDEAVSVLDAYASGELKTEAERREAIDYQAAYQWASENFVPQKFVDQCLAAALPDREV